MQVTESRIVNITPFVDLFTFYLRTLIRSQIVPCGKRTVRLTTDKSDGAGSSSSSGYESPASSISSTSSFELDKDAASMSTSSVTQTVYKIIPTSVPTTDSVVSSLSDVLRGGSTNRSDSGRASASAVIATAEAKSASKSKRSVSEVSAEDESSASETEKGSEKAKASAKAKAKRRNSNKSFEYTGERPKSKQISK
jgi:hypothetical protein